MTINARLRLVIPHMELTFRTIDYTEASVAEADAYTALQRSVDEQLTRLFVGSAIPEDAMRGSYA